jgi:hypothetical protein
MSIPLDRLYHYIENIAKEVRGDDVLIYRFWPHGSKKINDLNCINDYSAELLLSHPQVFCNDQEPLDFDYYKDHRASFDFLDKNTQPHLELNFRKNMFNMFDHCILLHSEKNSKEIEKYNNAGFIPAYYWSHAIIARDWFRYANHVDLSCNWNAKTTFLIYNRAWSGTREYRLKFAELLVENRLFDECQTSMAFNDTGCHYSNHKYQNIQFKPKIDFELYFKENLTTPYYSADFDTNDYQSTMCEVVLETLFDSQRWHLTEKILRPIAMGHPFLLCATPGSLKYLRSYGFKTFGDVIDETYDQIIDPIERLNQIIKVMKHISQWDPDTKRKKFLQLKKIAIFNKIHFFSDKFFNLVSTELKTNLSTALTQLVNSNTYERCINLNRAVGADTKWLEWQPEFLESDEIDAIQAIYAKALELKINNKY